MPRSPIHDVPPCRVVPDFLGMGAVSRLLAFVAAHELQFVSTRVGHGTLDHGIRRSRVLRNLGDLRPLLEQRFRERLDWAVQALALSPIDLASLELEIVAHGDGAFYREHIDTRTDGAPAGTVRALTGVYYFHRQPQAFTGGELRLHAIAPAADGERRFLDIPPAHDTCVLMPAWVPHSVQPVSCPSGQFMDSRFAINCWYRNRWARGG